MKDYTDATEYTCEWCEEQYLVGPSSAEEDERFCTAKCEERFREHWDESHFDCHGCGNTEHNDDGNFCKDCKNDFCQGCFYGEELCKKCKDEHYFYCEACESLVWNEDGKNCTTTAADGDTILCYPCFAKHCTEQAADAAKEAPNA